jgi:GNAT superfamily N-acetyltransferase
MDAKKRVANMTITREKSGHKQPRVGVVDNWHPNWKQVRSFLQRQSHGTPTVFQADGWLPARENLLVAFIDDNVVAGHLCFRVEPESGAAGKRRSVSAEVDSFGVDPAYANLGVAQVLRDAARARARELNCGRLRGFEG